MPILTYHHIAKPPEGKHPGLWVEPHVLQSQLQWFKDCGYVTITPADLEAPLLRGDTSRLPKRWLLITFDDGWQDNLHNALPVLQKLGMKATLFLSTGLMREHNSAQPTFEGGITMSQVEVQQWLDGGMQVESHTVSHPHLTEVPHDQVRYELTKSRQDLHDLFGIDSRWLCYPYGHFNRDVARIAQKCGYIGAFSTMRDNRFNIGQRYWLPRIHVCNDNRPRRLVYTCTWLYHFLHKRKNRRRYGDYA